MRVGHSQLGFIRVFPYSQRNQRTSIPLWDVGHRKKFDTYELGRGLPSNIDLLVPDLGLLNLQNCEN